MISTISTSLVDLSRSRYAVRVCDAVRAVFPPISVVLLALTLRERWAVAGFTVGQLATCFLFQWSSSFGTSFLCKLLFGQSFTAEHLIPGLPLSILNNHQISRKNSLFLYKNHQIHVKSLPPYKKLSLLLKKQTTTTKDLQSW